jgi:hypothetical protein
MIMTFWNKLKQLFTGKSLSAQFEEILLKDEAHTTKEEPVAKKKPTAKGKKK